MITKADLLEAIAECQGTRSPNSTTAVKLAAYYTILDHLDDKPELGANSFSVSSGQSFSESSENVVRFDGISEFAKAIDGRKQHDVFPIIDELMDSVKVLQPRLYDGVMRRLAEL